MEDKTGIGGLLEELKRVCLEHNALKSVLREGSPDSWRRDVLTFLTYSEPSKRVKNQFRETVAAVQSNHPLEDQVHLLLKALSQTNLDKT